MALLDFICWRLPSPMPPPVAPSGKTIACLLMDGVSGGGGFAGGSSGEYTQLSIRNLTRKERLCPPPTCACGEGEALGDAQGGAWTLASGASGDPREVGEGVGGPAMTFSLSMMSAMAVVAGDCGRGSGSRVLGC
jgi:hypothetical protein